MELRASALRLLRSAEPRRPRADLQGPQQFCSQSSTPPVRAQLAPRTLTHPPLLHVCALAPPDSSDLIKRAISFHPSGPQVISHFLYPGVPFPAPGSWDCSHVQLSLFVTTGEALSNLFRTELITPSSISLYTGAASHSGEDRGPPAPEHWLCHLLTQQSR